MYVNTLVVFDVTTFLHYSTSAGDITKLKSPTDTKRHLAITNEKFQFQYLANYYLIMT